MAKKAWLCKRVRCGTLNEPRKRKCVGCGGAAPKRRVPAHRKALRDVTYEDYIAVNEAIHGVGEVCAVCRRERDPERRLDRDHSHLSEGPSAGKPRGLCCVGDNILMPPKLTADKAEEIAAYLRRVEDYYAAQEQAA